MVEAVGIPFAYSHFTEDTGQQPPFICFFYDNSNDFAADNINYKGINALSIELYTEYKDFALQQAIETQLTDREIFYTREDEYLDTEKMYVTIYTCEVIIDGE